MKNRIGPYGINNLVGAISGDKECGNQGKQSNLELQNKEQMKWQALLFYQKRVNIVNLRAKIWYSEDPQGSIGKI